MKKLSGDLWLPFFWCLALGGLCLYMGLVSAESAVRKSLLLLGSLIVFLSFGFLALQNWARLSLAVISGLLLAARVVQIVRTGPGSRIGSTLLLVWMLYVLLRPATRRLFQSRDHVKVDVAVLLSFLMVLAALIGLLTLIVLMNGPSWVFWIGFGVPALALMIWGRPALARWLAARLERRPRDVTAEDWKFIREARRHRTEGRIFDAAQALERLSPAGAGSRSAAILRELLRMDQASEGEPDYLMERVCFEAKFEPDKAERAIVARQCAEWKIEQFHDLFDRRARLLDALLADAEGDVSVFGGEFALIFDRVADLAFDDHPEFEALQWWKLVRPKWTGDAGLAGLVVRLWRMEAYEAAGILAARAVERGDDSYLAEEAHLLELLRGMAEGKPGQKELEAEFRWLLLLPEVCDLLGLLLLSGPVVGKSMTVGTVTERLKVRLEMVGHLARLWADYEFDVGGEVAWLLYHLTGYRVRMLWARPRFENWWTPERERQRSYDEAFVRGLHAASEQAWENASRAFAEAESKLPERTAAGFNHAMSEREAGRPEVAEQLLTRLATKDSKEPYWWAELGDLRRTLGKSREALEAYARAATIGGLAPALAFRMGLVLAEEGRDEDAAAKINAAIGERPESELLEQISRFLESEGAHRLAQRYREEAFRRSLEESLEYPQDDGGDPSSN